MELSIFDCGIAVDCTDMHAKSLLNDAYGWFKKPVKTHQLCYRISRNEQSNRFSITRNGGLTDVRKDDRDFLYGFDKDIIIEIQKLRRDLYFIHAAVLEFNGNALALVGSSGAGKSTTTWGLLHHGFKYLSDELAPLDLTAMEVHPFPHAICLKTVPPDGYPLPAKTLQTLSVIHIPVGSLPCMAVAKPIPLAAIFFINYAPDNFEPVVQPLKKAASTARLFSHALNPLAHPGDGLDGAVGAVSKTRCFELFGSNLKPTCELIKTTFQSCYL